jgi:uncharacterized membrane protein
MSAIVEAPHAGRLRAPVRLVALVATGLLAGAVFAVWLMEGLLGSGPELYIAYKQATATPLSRALPPLGGLAVLATAACLVLDRDNRVLTGGAVVSLVGASLVTFVVHFPINATIADWTTMAPPPGWESVRDRWSAAHGVRTVLSVGAFVLVALGASRVVRRPAN